MRSSARALGSGLAVRPGPNDRPAPTITATPARREPRSDPHSCRCRPVLPPAQQRLSAEQTHLDNDQNTRDACLAAVVEHHPATIGGPGLMPCPSRMNRPTANTGCAGPAWTAR